MDECTARSRQPDSIGQAFPWVLLPILLLVLNVPDATYAQIVTNIESTQTAPLDLGTNVDTVGSTTLITGGTRPNNGTNPGTNLFHSFDFFTLGTGDIAHFMNDMQLPTNNIVGRVIGGEVSTIDGTLRTNNPLVATDPMNFGAANLWLVNPSGLLLGPNARVEVGGSVSMSTGNYLGFEGTAAVFDMLSSPASLGPLSVAPVAAFGFLGPELPAPITVQGSLLHVPEGQSLSLVGGDITVQAASLRAPGGQINLVSVASPGEVLVPSLQTGPNINGAPFTTMGTVTIKEGATLDVSGQLDVDGNPIGNGNSGSVFVRGGQLVMDASTIMANTVGTVDGASTAVDIQVSQNVVLTNGAQIVSRTDGPGDGGDITVSATDAISISGFDTTGTLSGVTTPFFFDPNSGLPAVTSGVFSTVSSSGNGGHISISAPTVTLENTATLATITAGGDTSGGGRGGDLALNVGTLSLGSGGFGNGALILSSSGVDLSTSLPTGTGQGGTVTVQGYLPDSAANSVTLTNGASILSLAFGPGLGADVQIAAGTIGLDGAGTAINTWTFGEGNGGNITLDAGDAGTLSVTNNATITTQTFGPGGGGAVGITADTLAMENFGNISTITSGNFGDGVGGNLSLNVGTLTLKDSSTIQSLNSNPGSGQGGNVTVQGLPGAVKNAAELVSLTGGSSLVSETSFGTAGDGGQISITAMSVLMKESGINSRTSGTGSGGDILVAVQQQLDLSNGATITGSTSSDDINLAPAGNITVQGLDGPGSRANSITLSGGGTAIQMVAPGVGFLGNIEVNAKTLNLTDGAAISAGTSTDTGTARDLTINADSVGISGDSRISSQSFSANAGPVTITANQLTLDKGSIVTSTSSLIGGRGGDVVIDVGKVSLTNDSSIKSETSGTGQGGDIAMNVGTLSLTNSQISSASTRADVVTNFDGTTEPLGTAGNVVITATGSFTSDASTIATSAEANHSGDISITAHSVQLSNGTVITADSNAPLEVTKLVLDQDGLLVPEVVGNGNAGNITVHSNSTFEMKNSSMTTDASQASGGQIEIIAPEMVRLINSPISTSVAGSDADTTGGNITIDPEFVIFQLSPISAKAFAGSGGAIDITAGVFLADPGSPLSVSSTLGVSGTINIQSPLQNVGGRLTPLSQQFSSAAALLAQQCAARVADGKFSTFVVAGREGLPAEPGGFLASPSLTAKLFGASLLGQAPPTQFPSVTGLFPEYDARPIQLAKLGKACR